MNENTVLITNILVIVLIGVFLYQRFKLNQLNKTVHNHHVILSELCMQTCEMICICARQDYLLNRIPLNMVIDIINSQPFSDIQKFHHFQMTGVELHDLEGVNISNELRNYIKTGDVDGANSEDKQAGSDSKP